MVKHLALLSYICLLFACKNSKPDYASLIKGDWLGQKTSEGFEHDQTEYLSFEDSTVNFGTGTGFLKYYITNDTLFLTDGNDNPGKFTIVKLTKDHLILLSGKRQQNKIEYYRINTKNNITPTFIYYANPECYDDCPVLALEIDSSRNVRFFGTSFTQLGANKGKLSENTYQSIINKIRALPVDSLIGHYVKPDKNDRPMQLAIVHENKVTRLSAYRYSREMAELHILLDKLMHVDAEVNSQLDSSLKWTYFHTNPILKPMLGDMPPPPPYPWPPIVEMQKFTPPTIED